mgnify:CR=1 FL=1|jgi:hypothetical protein
MKQKTSELCELFMANRDVMRSSARWSFDAIQICCAGIYTLANQKADAVEFSKAMDLIKDGTGILSNVRGTSRQPLAAMLALEEDPEKLLDRMLMIYGELKNEIGSSVYLPIAAMVIARQADDEEAMTIAEHTNHLYRKLKNEHPLLVNGQDGALIALLAISGKDDDTMIEEAEASYGILKQRTHAGNPALSLGMMLTACEGSAEEKCNKTFALMDKLEAAGIKCGSGYEMSVYGVMAVTCDDADAAFEEIKEIDGFLKEQKGFGMMGIGAKQRGMYACMLAQHEMSTGKYVESAAVSAAVAAVVAEQAAMMAAVMASSAAASSAASN